MSACLSFWKFKEKALCGSDAGWKMKEISDFMQTLQVFINGAVRYFDHIQDSAVTVGTPYLIENNEPAAFDVTGIIGVTGPYRGCVYFTAPRILIKHLLLQMGENDTRTEHVFDRELC